MLRLHYLGVLLYVAASHALYDSSSDVVDLTPQTFDRLVLKSDEIWLVEFYAPWCGHCKNLVPEYKKAATSLKGIVKVGAVNADDHKSLAQNYGVSGFPTIKIFSNGKHTPFQGQRTAEAFVEAALKAAKEKAFARLGKKSEESSDKSAVVTLTDDNFKELVLESEDLWLVEFYAPWCGHCKNLEPHWAKAADRLQGKVKVGALDATVHQATGAQYDVRGYPTIKVFSRGSADEYQGGRTADDIVAFALERLADNAPPPELVQVVGADSWRSCTDRALCVVAVLPHILDCGAVCRTQYLDTLKRLADKYRRRLWGWSWAEAAAQPALEEALELGGFGYPALAVLNAKKLKFATLRGAFSEEGIDEFLRELSFGRGRTAPVRGASLPSASATDPWDGEDGQLPQEEELDLSDVDLDRDEL